MRALVLVFLLVLFAMAFAGAPPPEVIPWRPLVMVDTMLNGRAVIVDTCWYITKDDYLRDVLGVEVNESLKRTERKLKVIEAYLRQREHNGNK